MARDGHTGQRTWIVKDEVDEGRKSKKQQRYTKE